MRTLLIRVGLVFTGLLLATTFLATRHSDRAWDEMLATADRLQQSIDSSDGERPVLHGQALPGLAHEEYARAVDALSALFMEQHEAYRSALDAGDASAVALRDALLDENALAVEALARGARSVDARYPIEWERGYSTSIPSLRERRALAQLAALTVHRHLDEGQPERAVDALLDGMQLGRDHYRAPLLIVSMIGCALVSIAANETLIDEGVLERLPPTALERLASGMRLVEEGLCQPDRARAGEFVCFVRTITARESPASIFPAADWPALQAWRYGFSVHAMCADFVEQSVQQLERLQQSEGQPWPVRRAVILELAAAAERSPNGIAELVSPKLLSPELSLYGCLARFRLARAAVEHRLSGQLPELEDPFGGLLQVEELDGVLSVTSRGGEQERFPTGRFRVVLTPGE